MQSSLLTRRRHLSKAAAALGSPPASSMLGTAGRPAPLPEDLTELSAVELSAAIRARRVSCVEVMEAYLARIHRYNPLYNAIVSLLDDDVCLAEARRADEELSRGECRGWLHGMPHAIKDLANARGLPTSMGSPLFAGTMPEDDDLAVARIRAAGALFIGKTNVPELGLGSQSYNPVFGVTRNAYDPALAAGGSSGGAAVGMAIHALPLADGSDMMGSLRNPAAFNNVIGFRPSQGRVPRTPSDLFYDQLPTSGPMGRNVEDTLRLLHTMSGFDLRAPLSLRDALVSDDTFGPAPLEGLRVGWMADYEGRLATEPGVLDLCECSLRTLEQQGAVVEPVLPDFDLDRLWECWLTLRHWSQAKHQPLLADPEQRRHLKPELIFEIEGSLHSSAADIFEASESRAAWYLEVHRLLERYDVLALPSAQVFPFAADVHWPEQIAGRPMDTYHRWMEVVLGGTLAGVPVVNVPVGFDERGRPMGMQLLGPFGGDEAVLEVAWSYERVTDHLSRRPTLRERL